MPLTIRPPRLSMSHQSNWGSFPLGLRGWLGLPQRPIKFPFLTLHHLPSLSLYKGRVADIDRGSQIALMPSSCAAFSQAFTVNSFRWRIRDSFRSDQVTRNGLTAAKYRGLGTRKRLHYIKGLFWCSYSVYCWYFHWKLKCVYVILRSQKPIQRNFQRCNMIRFCFLCKWYNLVLLAFSLANVCNLILFRGTQRQNFPVGVGTSFLRYNCAFCAV